MAIGKKGETLQAVSINADSFIGIAINIGGAASTVHLLEDSDLTFHFASGDKILSELSLGMDFVAGPGCTGITSTAEVIIS